MEKKKEPLFLEEVTKQSLEAAVSAFAAKNIEVETSFPTSWSAAIMADRTKIMRALDNILGNALKFTPPRGSVKILVDSNDVQIKVTVADSGIGIAPEFLEKIFERFYQVDTSYTRSSGGIGMGLTIARAIIKAHGGKVEAQSDGLGKGTKVSFILPLA